MLARGQIAQQPLQLRQRVRVGAGFEHGGSLRRAGGVSVSRRRPCCAGWVQPTVRTAASPRRATSMISSLSVPSSFIDWIAASNLARSSVSLSRRPCRCRRQAAHPRPRTPSRRSDPRRWGPGNPCRPRPRRPRRCHHRRDGLVGSGEFDQRRAAIPAIWAAWIGPGLRRDHRRGQVQPLIPCDEGRGRGRRSSSG